MLVFYYFGKYYLNLGKNKSNKSNVWEFSSVGSEHLPYKQRVGGSNPSTPTYGSYICTKSCVIQVLARKRKTNYGDSYHKELEETDRILLARRPKYSYKLIPIVILVTRVKSEWVGRETL